MIRAYTLSYFDGGEYKFRFQSDDYIQLFAYGAFGAGTQYYITPKDQWQEAYGYKEVTYKLPAGWYDLHFQMWEGGGTASVDLSWEKVVVAPPPPPPSGYYRDLSSLSDTDWNYQSRDNLFFDGNTQNGESLTSVKQVYSDLSSGIFGSYKAITAGYFDTTNYSGTDYGIDMAGLAGNTVKSVVAGTTTLVQNIAGNYFIGVKGDDGNLWIYGHLENYSVKIGSRVEAGNLIGTVFDGAYLDPVNKKGWMNQHLHLEVHKGYTYNRANSISPLQAYWKLRNR